MASIEMIQARVAFEFDIPLIDMTSQRRMRKISRPRQIAMYLARHLTQLSLTQIGFLFGGRDHTTVLYAVDHVEALMADDPEMRASVLAIQQGLEAPIEST